jgi:iron(III) transport system substrate-binding protein
MTREISRLLAAALALAAATTAADAAAPGTVSEIANYQGADRQTVLEEGAKKEGRVMIYTTGTQTQPLFEALGKKYPFVRVELYRAPTVDTTRRALEESKAGRPVADVFGLSTGGLHALLDSMLLQPYWTPEMQIYREETVQPNKHWVLDYESYLNLGYNTKALAEKDLPVTYDDLLDPKWKGKMATSVRGQTLPNWLGVAMLEKGEDYVKKLAQQDIRVFKISGRGLSNLIVSGEVPLSPMIYSSHMANSKEKGASVDWRALGPVYATIGAAAINRQAPHPHAAMLAIDFLLSREGQEMRKGLGYFSGRKDMESKQKPSKIHYLTERPDFLREFEKWANMSRQLFGGRESPLPEGFVDSGED